MRLPSFTALVTALSAFLGEMVNNVAPEWVPDAMPLIAALFAFGVAYVIERQAPRVTNYIKRTQ